MGVDHGRLLRGVRRRPDRSARGSSTRRASWARSPVVLAQLIQLGLAWSFRGGETTWIAIALAVVAVVVVAGVLHPASIEALSDDPQR